MLSIPHLIIIFLVALVVLGPEKLPEVARVMGKTMADFRRITNEFRVQVEDEMRDIERHTRDREIATALNPVPLAAPPLAALPPPVEFSELPAETTPGDAIASESTPTENPTDGDPHPA